MVCTAQEQILCELGEKGPRKKKKKKKGKRGHFMDAASPRKHLKIYNLTTTNAALMKLTIFMYLHKTFNWTFKKV